MDDLSGLSWTSSSNNEPKKPPMSSGMLYPTAQQLSSGISGTSTPASTSSVSSSKPATPATDSFANLVSFGPTRSDKNLPLLERQKKLEEEKANREAERRNLYEAQYGAQNTQFWSALENKSPAPAPRTTAPPSSDEDDILAAFDASAPVDTSTNFPVSNDPSPPPRMEIPQHTLYIPQQQGGNGVGVLGDDDDDPFGLSQLKQKPPSAAQPVATDDDDFLGLLGKPVSEIPRPERRLAESLQDDEHRSPSPSKPTPTEGLDHAVAELVDMGFPADKARQALDTTESGTDIQAAVGWILTQAHTESRLNAQNKKNASGQDDRHRFESSRVSSPAAKNSTQQTAAELGNNLLKTANALWKSGSKTVHRVVNDLNAEHDPNVPRWMREASSFPAQEDVQQSLGGRQQPPSQSQEKPGALTDEALLLESQPEPPRPPPRSSQPTRTDAGRQSRPSPIDETRTLRPEQLPRRSEQPRPRPPQSKPQQQMPPANEPPKSRLSRMAIEEQSAQAYVSPARRRRPAVQQPRAPSQDVDLLQSSVPAVESRQSKAPTPTAKTATPQLPRPNVTPSRPKPFRHVPELSAAAISSLHRHRGRGTEAYKRGDYAAAHEAFTSALDVLPDKHPIAITVYSNRAMTAMKIGEPKVSVADADNMLAIIGASKGEAETIDLLNGEPAKQMKDLYGKALMRKAEALEQLERWVDAAKTWKQAVESGCGGSTSIQGRNRCEKAAGIVKPVASKPSPAKKPALMPKRPPASATAGNSDAVNRLREANKAADRTDEERLALADSVDARLTAWKNGKQDNLRALLASLDTVLWPEAGWKKINMSELIMPNKVKIQYMKGISRVHPDKVCRPTLFLLSQPK